LRCQLVEFWPWCGDGHEMKAGTAMLGPRAGQM
jgi:hypothetical protein